jgi:hypothetical protein
VNLLGEVYGIGRTMLSRSLDAGFDEVQQLVGDPERSKFLLLRPAGWGFLGEIPLQQLIPNNPEGKNIITRVGRLASLLLGRCVQRRITLATKSVTYREPQHTEPWDVGNSSEHGWEGSSTYS